MRNRKRSESKAREQEIYCLNLKSNKIFKDSTQNVFYEKKAGIAEITKEAALIFCKRVSPDKFEDLNNYYEENPSDVFIDFENHFVGIENMYKEVLLNVIINRTIDNIFIKTHIAFFIYFQTIRNHNFWSKLTETFKKNNFEKFEMLIDLKHSLSNPDKLMTSILPFIRSKWNLYRTKEERFPLSDNPVLIRPLHIYLPLAPDLLLELNMQRSISEYQNCTYFNRISNKFYKEFEKQTIENSSREIIFSNQILLEKWKNSYTYQNHVKRNKIFITKI